MEVTGPTSWEQPGRAAGDASPRWALAAVCLWGILVAAIRVQPISGLPAGSFLTNHDGDGYLLRILEFRDCLGAGYWFPQWCTNFRQGFGSPYFSYYQPGFFYAASALPATISLVQRLALSTAAFSLLGYAFMYLLIARRFSMPGGALAGTALVLSNYSASELFVRGDFAEYSAMMTVPSVLYCLDGWLATGSRRQLAGFIVISGILITLHACIALATFAYLTPVLVVCVLWPTSRRRGLRGLFALALGVGVGAFYWMPVLGEWHYIAPERAFSGHFDFSRHFMEPVSFVLENKTDPMRAALGTVMWGLIAFGGGTIVLSWKRLTPGQRGVIFVAAGMGLYAAFLMSSVSASLWKALPLLYRLQFPWRLLSLVSVSAAAISGCLATHSFAVKNRWFLSAVAGWGAVNLCIVSILDEQRNLRPVAFAEPRTAADIAKRYFAPDLEDEWLPRAAKTDRNRLVERQVVAGPGTEASDYTQSQGLLACQVRTNRASYVDLPHFYFPVGWTARLDKRQLAIEPNQDGLMRVKLPADAVGNLTVQFSPTPMRKWGIAVTVVSLLMTIGAAVPHPRRFRQIMNHT